MKAKEQSNMSDILNNLTILSFEIGNDCNLKHKHDKCPINHRVYINKDYTLSIEKILMCIEEAALLGFKGYIAFHYYNEPLLYKNKIETIIGYAKEYKYLLFTNGLLLDRNVNNNPVLDLFDIVYVTCYDQNYIDFFNDIKNRYTNVRILNWDLDDRVEIYRSDYNNLLSCKRPLFELPIDHYGHIHLCCYDWNNQYYIGNVNQKSLKEILISSSYEKVLQMTKQRWLNLKTAPELCKRCNHILFTPFKLL
jgi:radical SAM protein with 4Fe4S-binding SPASM domain